MRRARIRRGLTWILLLCVFLSTVLYSGAASQGTGSRSNSSVSQTGNSNHDMPPINQKGDNRFNVVLVMDGSGSMDSTDPEKLRYEAVYQFMGLLAEKGNVVGAVVFSDDVDGSIPPFAVDSQSSKDEISGMISSTYKRGDTNTGAALSEAVSMLNEHGKEDLPSVIVLLSDGNTFMEKAEDLDAAMQQKADALVEAQKAGIRIFSVCLNANDKADVSEMYQISKATGGVFREVKRAEDLPEVFKMFYALIYGSSIVISGPEGIPSSGELLTPFSVPGFGVEEINVVVYGKMDSAVLVRPDGTESSVTQTVSKTFALLKTADVVPGNWILKTKGVPGDTITVSMVYNTNMDVKTEHPKKDGLVTGQELMFKAALTSKGRQADKAEQYEGYEAKLVLMDAYKNVIGDAEDMTIGANGFELSKKLEKGVYFYRVDVTGTYLARSSAVMGPLEIKDPPDPNDDPDNQEEDEPNTPPEPVNATIEKTVYVLPFKGGSYELNLQTLATDKEDSTLHYTIETSSFLEGTDYSVDENDVLTLDHFSLNKGTFIIRATDSGGLSCDIEVLVKTFNVGIAALIGLGAIALIVVAVLFILLRIALSKPFRGTLTVKSYCNGVYKGTPRSPKRGRCKLSSFGLDPVGLDYNKSYFQATGRQDIQLVTNIPVIWNNQRTNKVRIQSGVTVTLYIQEGDPRQLEIRFESRMKGKTGPAGRPRPAGKPGPRPQASPPHRRPPVRR